MYLPVTARKLQLCPVLEKQHRNNLYKVENYSRKFVSERDCEENCNFIDQGFKEFGSIY